MQILIVGAGVIGSIIAAHLATASHQITIVEQGNRFTQLSNGTITIQDGISHQTIFAPIKTVDSIDAADSSYDFALIPVQASHLQPLIPKLAANSNIKNIVIMVNRLNPAEPYKQLGERMLLGFPGMGGGLSGNEVVYQLANPWLQKTSFGEVNGHVTPRVRHLVKMFNQAGIPSAAVNNMVSWQQTHISWVVPLAASLYAAGVNNLELSQRPDLIKKNIMATRETLTALTHRQIPITPGKFSWVKFLPVGLQLPFWQKMLALPAIEYLAVRHCQAAPEEIKVLAEELWHSLADAGVEAPHYRELMQHIPGI